MLVKCPMCQGHPVNTVLSRILNAPCDFCGGKGQVDTVSVCRCGRPAIRLIEEAKICTRFACLNEVLEEKKAKGVQA